MDDTLASKVAGVAPASIWSYWIKRHLDEETVAMRYRYGVPTVSYKEDEWFVGLYGQTDLRESNPRNQKSDMISNPRHMGILGRCLTPIQEPSVNPSQVAN